MICVQGTLVCYGGDPIAPKCVEFDINPDCDMESFADMVNHKNKEIVK